MRWRPSDSASVSTDPSSAGSAGAPWAFSTGTGQTMGVASPAGAVAEQDRLWERTGSHAIGALKQEHKLPHGAPVPDVLVLGHTHVLDWAVERGRLYVNLGTWTERAFDASSPRDASLPLLHIALSAGELRASLRDLSAGEVELQRYEG